MTKYNVPEEVYMRNIKYAALLGNFLDSEKVSLQKEIIELLAMILKIYPIFKKTGFALQPHRFLSNFSIWDQNVP